MDVDSRLPHRSSLQQGKLQAQGDHEERTSDSFVLDVKENGPEKTKQRVFHSPVGDSHLSGHPYVDEESISPASTLQR